MKIVYNNNTNKKYKNKNKKNITVKQQLDI